MQFWEAQRKAKSRSWLFIVLFALLSVVVAVITEWLLRRLSDGDYDPDYPVIGLIFIGVSILSSLGYYIAYISEGGQFVADAMGAHPVNANTKNLKEIQLLNIVQEMAIAASIPPPPVYLMEIQQPNAFAAGTSPANAVVTVTRGALDLFTRDELQGVIAHELGHISNGDVKISMRLAALVMGFWIVAYIGIRLLGSGRREKGNSTALIGLAFALAGAAMWLFGSILKSCVSREREYLADASAVQYTRNPNGIANALRKLNQLTSNTMPIDGYAYSHLYFDSHSLFATHPSLSKRIEAIEGGRYTTETPPKST